MQRSDQLWSRTTLRPLFKDYIGGGWGSESASADHSEPAAVIRGTDIPGALMGYVQSVPRRFHKFSNLKSRKLQVGDLIFEVSGGSKDQPVGRALYCSDRLLASIGGNVIPASFCKRIVPDTTLVDGRFIYYVLRCLYDDRRIAQWQVQSTGISNFQFEAFLDECEVNLPSLEIQRRIASILSAYDDLIENNTRRVAILEELARRIYEEWFVRFRFPGHEQVKMVESELGAIPEGWHVRPLGETSEINAQSIRPANAPDEILYVDIASVVPGSITERQRYRFSDAPGRARRVVRHGDVIWSCVRPNRRSYALVLQPEPALVASTGFAVLSAKAVPYSYLYFAVTTDDFVGFLTNHATGAAYPAVTAATFEAAPLLVPKEGISEQFHCVVGPMLDLSETLRRKNANLRATRDLLLPKLISGELDVSTMPEPEEPIAA